MSEDLALLYTILFGVGLFTVYLAILLIVRKIERSIEEKRFIKLLNNKTEKDLEIFDILKERHN